MKSIFAFVLVMLFLLSACDANQGMEVRAAWARPAAQGENGAVYFIIYNAGREHNALTGVTSDVADAVEMHESRMEGDVMQMHQLESVPLPADAETSFKPGGLHIMLIGLRKDIKIGDEIEITLHFENSEDMTLLVPVQEATASETH